MRFAMPGARLIELLVALYPPAFRRRFGPEMAGVVRQSARQLEARDTRARLAWTLRMAADLGAGAIAEWWTCAREGLRVRSDVGPPLWDLAWARLRQASPQRTVDPEEPLLGPFPELRRRYARRALPPLVRAL